MNLAKSSLREQSHILTVSVFFRLLSGPQGEQASVHREFEGFLRESGRANLFP